MIPSNSFLLLQRTLWKFPGGLADLGEDIGEFACLTSFIRCFVSSCPTFSQHTRSSCAKIVRVG